MDKFQRLKSGEKITTNNWQMYPHLFKINDLSVLMEVALWKEVIDILTKSLL